MSEDHVSLGNPSGATAANVLGIFLELGGRLNHSTKGIVILPFLLLARKESSTASSKWFPDI